MTETKRTPFIAGNWKLNKTVAEAQALIAGLLEGKTERWGTDVEVCVAPVATALSAVSAAIGDAPIFLSAQNTHSAQSGAFTGELSPTLLRDVGCSHVILGHSERRGIFGETDEVVHAKIMECVQGPAPLAPIVCVGESLEQREAGDTLDVVIGQVDAALGTIPVGSLGGLILAYEPIWAIGTGKTASPDDAQEVHAQIRERVRLAKGDAFADALRILYGGSVKPANAESLLGQADIDGALVGGASLKPELFLPIIEAAL